MSLNKQISAQNSPPAHLEGDQPDAYRALIDRVTNVRGTSVSGLRGYAGTGKTYLTGVLVEEAIDDNFKVFVTAPTHQAAAMLREHVPTMHPGMCRVSTIHSLLGLQLQQDKKDGGYSLVRDPSSDDIPYDKKKCLVIVDEGSMIGGESLAPHIYKAIEDASANWLIIGDPAQLPPPDDEPSDLLSAEGYTMKQTVRQQAGNPIIEAANAIRRGEKWEPHAKMSGDNGIYTTSDGRAIVNSVFDKLRRGDYQDNPYVCRILAAHNKTVKQWNQRVKDTLFPHSPEWDRDMWGVAQETWSDDGEMKIRNSDLLFVEEADKKHVMVDGIGLPIWVLRGKLHSGGATKVKTLAEEGREEYEYNLEKRLEDAKANGGSAWKRYYTLKEALCEVRYPFASTVHKGQGSTYETAYIDDRDLSEFPGGVGIMQSLRYVAFTRASKNVGVLV